MELTIQTESLTMYASRKLREGFTLVELIIVMVILGIMAAVAVPKMGTVITKSGQAAENAVISQLESAAEIKALDNVLLSGVKSYPASAIEVFNQLEKKQIKLLMTGEGVFRAVLHREVSKEQVQTVIETIRSILAKL